MSTIYKAKDGKSYYVSKFSELAQENFNLAAEIGAEIMVLQKKMKVISLARDSIIDWLEDKALCEEALCADD